MTLSIDIKDKLQAMKSLNIKFNIIDESRATEILANEVYHLKLLSYATLFDKYRDGEKIGQYLNLEFAYLYDVFYIDVELQHLILNMVLDIELVLKTKFLWDVEKTGINTLEFLEDFWNTNADFLDLHYNSDNIDLLDSVYGSFELKKLPIYDFLEVIQFGTFQRVMRFFYQSHSMVIYNRPEAPFEPYLNSVRTLRNVTAHNNGLLSNATLPLLQSFGKNLELLAFLGKHGIKHRSLDTNMSKRYIHDICCLIDLYCNIEQKEKVAVMLNKWTFFLEERCTCNIAYYKMNSTLRSLHTFFSNVIKIYNKGNNII
jgi:abortive infection bacteriophage resistance protein